MSYLIPTTDPAKLTTPQLLAEIDGIKALAVEVVERLALILKELKRRRQKHVFFHDRILCFWESIANNQLSAEAAILLANRDLIKAVLPLPRHEQEEVARGKEIGVAFLNDLGRMDVEYMPIRRMSKATIGLVFGPTGIRKPSEQERILYDQDRSERMGMITVLRDECALRIGNQKIVPEELKGPLLALGYRLTLARDKVDA